jgi:hypothetical protein
MHADLMLTVELAMTLRFGFFVFPSVCLVLIKYAWYVLPCFIFLFLYPAYASIPVLMYIDCAYYANQQCFENYIENTQRYLSPRHMSIWIETIRHGLDMSLNNTMLDASMFVNGLIDTAKSMY